MPDSMPNLDDLINPELELDLSSARMIIINGSSNPKEIKLQRNKLKDQKTNLEITAKSDRSSMKHFLLITAGSTLVSGGIFLYGYINKEPIYNMTALTTAFIPLFTGGMAIEKYFEIRKSSKKIKSLVEGIAIAEKRIDMLENRNP